MGILNVTPDSFSDGGRYLDPASAEDRALEMQAEGADFIDVGGESTRPGSGPVSEEEELRRVLPVLKRLGKCLRVPISIDTSKPIVAQAAVDQGAALVNDVSGLSDPDMISVVARSGTSVILMHRQGAPKTMQENPFYRNPVREISEWLRERARCAEQGGIGRTHILLDPGFGFGKRLEDNLEILRNLRSFVSLGYPVVVGASRKSFLRKIFGGRPEEILRGGVAAASLAASQGVAMIRTHDVAATRQGIALARSAGFS